MARNLIGYVRVSTDKQGKSGLGIEAQKHALERFAAAEGFELGRVYVAPRAVHRRRAGRRHRPIHAAHLRRPGRERAAPDRRAHQGRAAGRQGPWRGSGRAS